MISVSEQVRKDFPDLRYCDRILAAVTVLERSAVIEDAKQRLLDAWSGTPAEAVAGDSRIAPYRDFYRSLPDGPGKARPATEHLLQRCVLRGFLPSINNVVDACNIASATYVVPMAAFDLDRFAGEAVLRYSRPQDRIQPIGRPEPQRVRGRQVVLADERDVISVFASLDSDLHKIQPGTTRVLLVACGVSGVDDRLLADAVAFAGDLVERSLSDAGITAPSGTRQR